MLGLTVNDIVNINGRLGLGSRVKTLVEDHEDGFPAIAGAVNAANLEPGVGRRAARLAIDIQYGQPFNDGNTRTATLCVYALLAVESSHWLRRKPYQVYAQVGKLGPQHSDAVVDLLADFINENSIGVTNITDRFESVVGELPNVAEQVAAWKAQAPIVSQQLRSWYNNRGY